MQFSATQNIGSKKKNIDSQAAMCECWGLYGVSVIWVFSANCHFFQFNIILLNKLKTLIHQDKFYLKKNIYMESWWFCFMCFMHVIWKSGKRCAEEPFFLNSKKNFNSKIWNFLIKLIDFMIFGSLTLKKIVLWLI